MQSNPDIEESIKRSLKVRAFRVKGSKVYVKIVDPRIALNDIASVDMDNPDMAEHMGQKFVKIVTEEAEVVFLPLEKYNEIRDWGNEQRKKREAGQDARKA